MLGQAAAEAGEVGCRRFDQHLLGAETLHRRQFPGPGPHGCGERGRAPVGRRREQPVGELRPPMQKGDEQGRPDAVAVFLPEELQRPVPPGEDVRIDHAAG